MIPIQTFKPTLSKDSQSHVNILTDYKTCGQRFVLPDKRLYVFVERDFLRNILFGENYFGRETGTYPYY